MADFSLTLHIVLVISTIPDGRINYLLASYSYHDPSPVEQYTNCCWTKYFLSPTRWTVQEEKGAEVGQELA
jgi:hypothetical protein